jgi:hypothetical protein
MKTQKKFISSGVVFSILTLASLNAFPAGPTGTVRQGTSGTSTGTVANPTVEQTGTAVHDTMANPGGEIMSPALQYCGKNYVQTKLEKFPLEGSDPKTEGGDWWACKLRKSFSYTNNSNDACPAVTGKELESTTEVFQPVNANYYRCTYKGISEYQSPQCSQDFSSPSDTLQKNLRQSQGTQCYWTLAVYKDGKVVIPSEKKCYNTYTNYYDTSYGCKRNDATFPENNFNVIKMPVTQANYG